MTQQTLPSAPPLTVEGQFTAQHRERRFKYDGKEFDDPGAEYSIREVLGYLAATYPELANGSWTTTTFPDYDVITFHKVTGEKGLTVPDLLSALDTLPTDGLPAVVLTEQLLQMEQAGEITTDALVKMAPDIQAAHHQMKTAETQAAQMLDRILHLPAAPHPRVPLGF